MDNFTVRRATPGDKDAILRIRGDVYDGLDYLPDWFDYFMSCSNVKAYVGEVQGEIIAFSVGFLVDDGQTVISRSGRVSKEYSGQRVYSSLTDFLLKDSGATENSFTTLDSNSAVLRDSFKRVNKEIVSKSVNRYHFNPHTICTDVSGKETLKPATDDDLRLHMTSDTHRKYLFPDDVFIVDWVPFRLLPSNIPYMRVPEKMNILTSVVVKGERNKGLLTVLTVSPVKDPPFAAMLEIYGDDAEALESHIACQIDFAKSHGDATMCWLVFCDDALGMNTVDGCFNRFGPSKVEWGLAETGLKSTTQFMYRKAINQ